MIKIWSCSGKTILYFILFIFIAVVIYNLFTIRTNNVSQVPLNQVIDEIKNGQVKKVSVDGQNLNIELKNGNKQKSIKEEQASFSEILTNAKINLASVGIDIKSSQTSSVWVAILSGVLPVLLIAGFIYFMMRSAQAGNSRALSFGQSKARLFGSGQTKVKFSDVAGLVEPKQELLEVVEFLKNPSKFIKLGAEIPKGVLLVGPPGTGKTLLAKAVAGEAKVPFFSISASEFVEMFVGVGASRVRDLFEKAKRNAPAIIFIDELDAIGRLRGAGLGGSHDEREQTLNQILVEMDGFERDTNVIVLSATNRGDILDPALLRPGRFDRKVVLDLPDINDREEILKIHSRGKPLALNINLREVAERTPGFSGADLANLVNEAAILAAKKNKHQVYQEEMLESIEKVLLGPERKSHILSKKEKEIAAYHESGHALVSSSLPGTEPVRKISIIARGMAAGYTLKMPTEERKIKTKTEFLAEMATLLGGYCAEKLKFGEMTTGAANDLERASELARKLIKEYGMSSLGPISFGEKEELVFLGKEIGEQRNYSEEVAAKIDKEVSRFIEGAQKQAKKILTKKKGLLEKIAKKLIEKETIEKEEFENLIKEGKTKIFPKSIESLKIKKIKVE